MKNLKGCKRVICVISKYFDIEFGYRLTLCWENNVKMSQIVVGKRCEEVTFDLAMRKEK